MDHSHTTENSLTRVRMRRYPIFLERVEEVLFEKKNLTMKECRLSPDIRAALLKSCDILLADSIAPRRIFKSYLPCNWDTPLFMSTSAARGLRSSDVRLTVNSQHQEGPEINMESIHQTKNEIPELKRDWVQEYRHIGISFVLYLLNSSKNSLIFGGVSLCVRHIISDCEWSIKMMDRIFNASFMEFVKNEANCDVSGRELSRIVKDFKLDQIIHGLKWLVDGWSVEATSRVLRNVFNDWLPELSGLVMGRIGASWFG